MSCVTFVTGNANKLKEVVAILASGVSDGETPRVGKFTITNRALDLEELQGLIEQVATHKANAAAQLVEGPVLVEDTCLGLTAFNDLPGPYIKWFVQAVGLQGIVDMLYKFDDKSAKAITTFAYCEGPGREVHIFQGITEGQIVDSRGSTDFGWDAIFEPNGFTETYAEMDKLVKNSISHRSKALAKVKEFMLEQ